MFAATNKHVTAVQALLRHPQININMQDNVSVVLLTFFLLVMQAHRSHAIAIAVKHKYYFDGCANALLFLHCEYRMGSPR